MKFRIIYIGKTGKLNDLEAAAKEINPTAHKTHRGIITPDDCIEATVSSVEEGKDLMKKIYKKVRSLPKCYTYAEGDSFWSPDFKKYIGTEVWSSSYDYVKEPKHTEDIEAFVEAE